jgi:DNA-binding response OmpR family regulator
MKDLEYLKSMRILLAEDDAVIAKSLFNVLDVFVKKVFVAKDGKEALDIYNKESIDIIILDIQMPYMSGIEVAQQIRKSDTITPILIVSAFNDIAHLHEAIPLMLVEYLIKPLSFEQIQKALSKCVFYVQKQGLLLIQINQDITYNKTIGEFCIYKKEKITLPKNEKKLLDILLQHKNQLVNKEYLESEIFDLQCGESSLKNLIYRLKKRCPYDFIYNVKELGYKAVLDG